MPGGGKIDVSIETMTMVLNRRSNIRDLYCANLRANGLPWCPVVNGEQQPDVVGIITDWWTRVAGGSDDPSLYNYSLAQYVEKQMGIPSAAQPGNPITGVKASQSIQPSFSGETVPSQYWIIGIVGFVSLMFLRGSTRSQRLTYQDTGIGSGSRVTTRRR